MGYKALINSQLRRAFVLLKDLATDATMTKKANQEFDFASGEVSTDTAVQTVVKLVETTTAKLSKDGATLRKKVMLKSEDALDPTLYDSITINGVVWQIGPVLQTNGFIVMLELFKEA